uniref:amidohydrolase n=1 Tax=Ndongobacter massiliensis TaxID=1871025 RepID=UPI000A78CCE8|nr:amidohydrolase [Ndongobacter massiliensis]
MLKISDFGKQYSEYVISKRREFHKMPEISLQEYETSKKVVAELKEIGIEGRIVSDTGVLAEIQGEKPGKCVALRADMDALAVTEQTGLPFASENEGVMHACGHDNHMAMLLGAAKILYAIRDEIPGTVRLIFEPAEEVAKGAKKMIAAGAMEGVDSIFGIHVWSDIPAGKISVQEGPIMASADFYTIDIVGKSCHGSKPDQGVDAIVAGAALVNNLQSIVSREINPLEPVVVSIGEFHAGEQSNVLAGKAHLSGTTRTFNDEIRERLPQVMQRIVQHTGETFRAEMKLNYTMGSSVVINDPLGTRVAQSAVRAVLGEEAFYHYEKTPGGENFSEYLHEAPGCFALLGVRNEDCHAIYPQHSCYYNVDESVLIQGSMIEAQYAINFLTGNF